MDLLVQGAGRSRREQDIHWYKDISREVQSLTRCDHKDHLDEITANLTMTPKCFSNWIKCFSRDTTLITDLHYLGNIYRSPVDKATIKSTAFSVKTESYLFHNMAFVLVTLAKPSY